jgi:hypothetical protein
LTDVETLVNNQSAVDVGFLRCVDADTASVEGVVKLSSSGSNLLRDGFNFSNESDTS